MNQQSREVVITQRLVDDQALAWLRACGCNVTLAEPPAGQGDGDFTEQELIDRLSGAAGWIVGHAHVTRSLLERLPRLRVISRRGVGYERVDIAAVATLGKVACIASGGNHESVADHTLALMLAAGHRLHEARREMDAGSWKILSGNDLYRRTVGVIGLGRIGRAVVRRLRGFEVEVLALSGHEDPEWAAANGVRYVSLDELLQRSDYVTLHAPLGPSTRHLIDGAALRRMKPGAYLINTARGGLVDDVALLEALSNGQLAGAALDVFESESDPAMSGVTSALLALPNLIATPHAGASSREGLERTNMIAARCVTEVLDGRDPPAECVVADGRAASG